MSGRYSSCREINALVQRYVRQENKGKKGSSPDTAGAASYEI